MRFAKDRCLQCGTPSRGKVTPNPDLKADGTYASTHFWFCSNRCHDEALSKYVPAEFQYDSFDETPQYKSLVKHYEGHTSDELLADARTAIGQSRTAWSERKVTALKNAPRDMSHRVWAEYDREVMSKVNADIEAGDKYAREQATKLEQLKPRPIPERLRFQHTHILAPSGFGKTTLLQQIILDDLATDNPPAYVVIDPKGLLVERISRLAVFDSRLKDRIVIVDPTHDELPALSMFSMPHGVSNATARARILNHLIETFAYIFSSADARLTQRQSIPFSYVVRLVFQMGGDLNTLMDVLESKPDDPRFAAHINQLAQTDAGAKRFFGGDFHSKTFSETRQQIRARLYEIISKPELMQMFAAKENRLSLFDCLQQRKIVLVNTAMGQLGTKASALLGRYFISMTLNAAFSRFAIPKDQWHPAYLVIDEFQDFADEDKTPELLRLAREYNLGVLLAHQTMHSRELSESLKTAISTNTTIKYSSNPEGIDLNYMARDLRCDADFLKKNATPTDTGARFACFARGMGLEHPFIVEVPFGNIQDQPQMTEEAYQALLARNRAAIAPRTTVGAPAQALPIVETAKPAQKPVEPPEADTHTDSGPTW